tara:strand:- start:3968 stop:6907 length:2940 start_codon:yes stop_codon:yes gene_type:complete
MSQWKRVLVATNANGQTLDPRDFKLDQSASDWSGFDNTAVPSTPTDWFLDADNDGTIDPSVTTFVATKKAALAGKNTLKIIKNSTDGGDDDTLVLRFWQDQQWSDDGYGSESTPTWPGINGQGWYGESDNVTGSTEGGQGLDIHSLYNALTPVNIHWNIAGSPAATSTAVYSGVVGTVPTDNNYASGCWEDANNLGTCLAPGGVSDATPYVPGQLNLTFTPGTGTHDGEAVGNGLIAGMTAGVASKTLYINQMKVALTGQGLTWSDGNGESVQRTVDAFWTGNTCQGNGSGQQYGPTVVNGEHVVGGGDLTCGDIMAANHYVHPTFNSGTDFGAETLTFGVGGGAGGTWNESKHVLNAITLNSNVDSQGHTTAALNESSEGRTLDINDLKTGYGSYDAVAEGGHCYSAAADAVDTTYRTMRECCEGHSNTWNEATVECDWTNITDDYEWVDAQSWNPEDGTGANGAGSCYGSTNSGPSGWSIPQALACDKYWNWEFLTYNSDGDGNITQEGQALNIYNENNAKIDFSSAGKVNKINFKDSTTDPMNGDMNILTVNSSGGTMELKFEAPGPNAGCDSNEGGAGGDSETCDGWSSGGVLRYIETGDGLENEFIGSEWDNGAELAVHSNAGTITLGEPTTLTSGTSNALSETSHTHLIETGTDFTGAAYDAGTGTPKILTTNSSGTLQGGFKINDIVIQTNLISDSEGGGSVDILSGNVNITDNNMQLNTLLNEDGEIVNYGAENAYWEMGVGGGNSGAGNVVRESTLLGNIDGVSNVHLEQGNSVPMGGRTMFRFSDFASYEGYGAGQTSYSRAIGGCDEATGWGDATADNASYPGRCSDGAGGSGATFGVDTLHIQAFESTTIQAFGSSWFESAKSSSELGNLVIDRHESFAEGSDNATTEGHLAVESGFIDHQDGDTVKFFKIGVTGGTKNYYKGNSQNSIGASTTDGLLVFNTGTGDSTLKGLYINEWSGGGNAGDSE